jgi:hypothetical protein
VRVPEEVAAGKAKVVLSFAAWKDGNVQPATLEAVVEEATPPSKK